MKTGRKYHTAKSLLNRIKNLKKITDTESRHYSGLIIRLKNKSRNLEKIIGHLKNLKFEQNINKDDLEKEFKVDLW